MRYLLVFMIFTLSLSAKEITITNGQKLPCDSVLYYENNMPQSIFLSKPTTITVGENKIKFDKGPLNFYLGGEIKSGKVYEDSEVAVGNYTITLKKTDKFIFFHPSGALKLAIVKPFSVSLKNGDFTFAEDEVFFHESGVIEEATILKASNVSADKLFLPVAENSVIGFYKNGNIRDAILAQEVIIEKPYKLKLAKDKVFFSYDGVLIGATLAEKTIIALSNNKRVYNKGDLIDLEDINSAIN